MEVKCSEKTTCGFYGETEVCTFCQSKLMVNEQKLLAEDRSRGIVWSSSVSSDQRRKAV